MKKLPLDLLKTFVVFSKATNISAAARKLGLSQPAVSIQLKKLEDLAPLPLFTFQGKKKVLSNYGRTLFHSVSRRLSDLENSIDRVNLLYSDPENITIKVGARKENFNKIAMEIDFECRVEFVPLTNEDAIEQLLRHEIDVAVAFSPPDSANIVAKKFFSSSPRFSIHRDLLEGRKLSLQLIRRRSFLQVLPSIAYMHEAPFLSQWSSHCGLRLEDLNIRSVCEDWFAVTQLVAKKVGFAFIPEDIPIHSPDIVQIDIPKRVIPPVDFYYLYHRDLKDIAAIRSLFLTQA